jgi:NAD(P)H-hydrate epimerase
LVSGTPYDNYDAVAVGPGLGTSDIAAALVAGVLAEYAGPLLLDADALNIVASCGGEDACRDGIPGCAAARRPRKDGSCVNACIPRRIVTPHPGEAARLLGTDTASVQADRAGAAAELARRYGAVAVLKGHRTLVAAPMPARDHGAAPVPAEIAITENTTGNPGMATGGSGDALTGLILAFCAQGMPAADAARAGVYIHGLAGDLAAAEKGEYGMIASDIVSFLPNAILKVTKS